MTEAERDLVLREVHRSSTIMRNELGRLEETMTKLRMGLERCVTSMDLLATHLQSTIKELGTWREK
jgi:hypothetical protein